MMDTELLRKVGNFDQVCGIKKYTLSESFAKGVEAAEFYNQAGLRFTVIPDRCMDIYDLSYKGVNVSFHSRNGIQSPNRYSAAAGEFSHQWQGGMLSTCGLDNVGGNCVADGVTYPVHGRVSAVPAENFGTYAEWRDNDFVIGANGEIHQKRMYGSHLVIRRNIETSINAGSLKINDMITNLDCTDEPFMLLYHINFGYPLLDECCRVFTTKAGMSSLVSLVGDPSQMTVPIDRRGEELYLGQTKTDKAYAMLFNPEKELAGYVAFDTDTLPRFLEWKNMKSHDYVLALEPCNTWGTDRQTSMENGKIEILKAFSSIKTSVEIGVIEGNGKIKDFIADKNLNAPSL